MVRSSVGGAGLRSAVVLVALVLGPVACTDGGGAPDEAGPTTTRPSTTTTPGAAAASSTTAAGSSTTAAPAADLRRADLAAAPRRVRCPGGEVALQPGVAAPGVDDRPVVLDPFEPQFIDLTGDGRPEAVVEASCRLVDEPAPSAPSETPAPAPVARSVIVLAADGRDVVQLGQPLDGGDPTVVGTAIAVGRAASVSTAASGEATSVVYEPFRYDGSGWVPGSDGTPVQEADAVTLDGIGGVLVGAPFGEVAISTGQPVEAADPAGTGGSCVDVVLPAAPEGIGGVGGDGQVLAVQVANPAVRTAEGLGVGSTEVEVQFTFPGQVSVLPHERVPGGHHLIVDFPDQPDRVLLFSTDGTVVTDFAAGAAGWADVVGGCA